MSHYSILVLLGAERRWPHVKKIMDANFKRAWPDDNSWISHNSKKPHDGIGLITYFGGHALWCRTNDVGGYDGDVHRALMIKLIDYC